MSHQDLVQYHHDRTADALATVACRLRETADQIDRQVAMAPAHALRDLEREWTPHVVRSLHEFRTMVGNLGALDAAVESAAQYDRLVRDRGLE